MSDEERIETDASEDAIEHEEAPIAGQPDWLAQRFARLVELAAEPDAYRDGAELQRLKRVAISRVEPGVIEAHVRERSSRPRRVVLRSPVLPADVWDALVLSVSEHPAHQARMLAGELPEDIDDLIAGVRGDRWNSRTRSAAGPLSPFRFEGWQRPRSSTGSDTNGRRQPERVARPRRTRNDLHRAPAGVRSPLNSASTVSGIPARLSRKWIRHLAVLRSRVHCFEDSGHRLSSRGSFRCWGSLRPVTNRLVILPA
jgi:hypothetical protein